ncbi:UBP1-associated protein 2C [Quillaja saponaria]|uniref:UBP1-associated protein 2C n=1 Tax=Quillaja saponaria TaxID=32244 RepID=A0AAD7M2G6_QUISA|nr:UBP1-associated protein 2C [Quillaja saponaria]
MDFTKKRKAEENGSTDSSPPSTTTLSPQDIRRILQPLSQDQLLDLLQSATLRHPEFLEDIRALADRDTTLRKLFVRGLAGETTTETLRSVFSSFGELDEAIVIFDKSTGATDVSLRKIFVGNVPFDISSERLLAYFSMFGEIEEGPLGFDKGSGKLKGFAFFVYKTEEGARASLVEPVKNIDGHQVVCKFAVDNKKGRAGGIQNQTQPGFTGDGMPPQPQQSSLPGSMMGSQYGGPGNVSSYTGYTGGHHGPPPLTSNNYGLQSSVPSSIGGAPLPAYGTQFPSSFNTNSGGYGPGFGGAYGSSQYGGPATGEYVGRLPPSSTGMSSGGFTNSSHNGLTSSALPTQYQQPPQLPRGPPGGMYQGVPPYY